MGMALRLCIGFIVLTAFSTCLRAGERSYVFYDVGNLGCPDYNQAAGINDRGVVAGGSHSLGSSCLARGFRWFNGTITNLDELYEGNSFKAAAAISETGAILGSGSPIRVFIWAEGQATEMDVPEGCEANGSPESINESGTMAVGDCDLDSDEYAISVPSLYWTSDGAAIALGFLPDAPETADGWAEDVNEDGVVVGRISYGAGGVKSFIWSDGVMTELVNTLGGTHANA